MGHQQLLLLTLGVIIVSIASAVGMTMFVDNAVQLNRDAVSNDLVYFATRAMQHYRKPQIFGGGGHSFAALTMRHLVNKVDASGVTRNMNGAYQIVSVPSGNDPLVIKGTGNEVGRDGSSKIVLFMNVWPDSVHIDATHAGSN
ncbi:MAG: hypothetical protein HY961_03275 [Ignavibacteriae bacterium]|nr:hypothetical protein [Ignavibacteriota bacterium]